MFLFPEDYALTVITALALSEAREEGVCAMINRYISNKPSTRRLACALWEIVRGSDLTRKGHAAPRTAGLLFLTLLLLRSITVCLARLSTI